MIRIPTSHAAVTVPLPASSAAFPGIRIGRSLLDGRAFRLSPVMVDSSTLPSTNSLALGGLGAGKSATSKVRMLREIQDHQHQGVVIDTHGEDGLTGEWRPVTEALGGRVIQAGAFTLNPLSNLFPRGVREQLVRSLILAVEPDALTYQATHALQHALSHPKAAALGGLVDALVSPQDGRWPAKTLAEWGVGAAIALSRYTEGALSGIFDGPDSSLPETDLPLISFDFTTLDRQSPAIPSLMAAVTCWIEHIWLPQAAAVHRHLMLEEAWQILLSPATAGLVQRLLKNSRRAGLSVEAAMHTLSDLGDGPAQDLARLCEVAHVGRLVPEEAAAVGAVLGLPQWAVDMIPTLGPGQAVWKVGPHFIDVIQTVLSEEEAALTDTSSRRRRAQQAPTLMKESDTEDDYDDEDQQADLEEWEEEASDQQSETIAYDDEDEDDHEDDYLLPPPARDADAPGTGWDWDMPPTVIDRRHHDVIAAAREGRCSEAAELAVIGEREDIRAHGLMSDQALMWLSTRAAVADLCGTPDTAAHLRATVSRMGKDVEWWHADTAAAGAAGAEHDASAPPAPASDPGAPALDHGEPPPRRRRIWPYAVVAVALAVASAAVWQQSGDADRDAKAATYKGQSGASLTVDSVNADLIAKWSKDRDHVIVELSAAFEPNARFLRIDAAGRSVESTRKDGRYTKPPELSIPVRDYLADVTVQVEVGGASWKEGARGTVRKVRLSPTGEAYDADTGQQLPRN